MRRFLVLFLGLFAVAPVGTAQDKQAQDDLKISKVFWVRGTDSLVLNLVNGRVVTGILHSENDKEVRLITEPRLGGLLTIAKKDIEERRQTTIRPAVLQLVMPAVQEKNKAAEKRLALLGKYAAAALREAEKRNEKDFLVGFFFPFVEGSPRGKATAMTTDKLRKLVETPEEKRPPLLESLQWFVSTLPQPRLPLPGGKTLDSLAYRHNADIPLVGPQTDFRLSRDGTIQYFYSSAPATGSGGRIVTKNWKIPAKEAALLLDQLLADGLLDLPDSPGGFGPSHMLTLAAGKWSVKFSPGSLPAYIADPLLPLLQHAHPDKWNTGPDELLREPLLPTFDADKIAKELDMVIEQVSQLEKAALAKKEFGSAIPLRDALSSIQKTEKTPVTEYVQYRGWWLFSTAGQPLRYHSGQAIRPGGFRLYKFGFW